MEKRRKQGESDSEAFTHALDDIDKQVRAKMGVGDGLKSIEQRRVEYLGQGVDPKEAYARAFKDWSSQLQAMAHNKIDYAQARADVLKDFKDNLAKSKSDGSLDDVKSVGIDAARSNGIGALKGWVLDGKPFTRALSDAIDGALQDIAKEGSTSAFKAMDQQGFTPLRESARADLGPDTPYALLLCWWQTDAFSTFGKDGDDLLMTGSAGAE